MGTHPIFESDFDCLTEMAENPQFEARIIDDHGRYVYYTDGAARNGRIRNNRFEQVHNEGIVGIGIYGGEQMTFCKPDKWGSTSNYAELFAIQTALAIAWNRGERRITIRTDSKFAKKCILHLYDQWFERYGTGKWYTMQGTPVVHRGILYNIVELKKLFDQVWIEWVPRNSDVGSRLADMLAKFARKNNVVNMTNGSKIGIEEPIFPPPPFAE